MQPLEGPYTLIDLTDNKRNELLFDKYAAKRLSYFNDFVTVIDPEV